MRAAFQSPDDRLPFSALQTREEAFGESLSRPHFIVLLLSVSAWFARNLSAVRSPRVDPVEALSSD
jgi:hypothetical protein